MLISAGVAVALAGCGSVEQTTTLQVRVSGHSEQVDIEQTGQESCSYVDGWLSAGDEVVLRNSEGEVLGVSVLRAVKQCERHADPCRISVPSYTWAVLELA